VGFWQTLKEWSPLFIPLFGIVITAMGFWMRAELFRKMVEFQATYIKPLADKLDKEMEILGAKLEGQGRTQDLAVQELRGITGFLRATIESIKSTADKLDSGSIQAAVTLGKHEEQIVTLFRRVERNEDRLQAAEQRTERRRDS
jgi:hypothetical protein